MTEIVRYPVGRNETSYSIPSTVVSIGKIAFISCRNLINIELPPSVSIIGDRAFSNCSNLTRINYQNKHLVFSPNAFEYCSTLPTSNIIYEVPTALFLELAQKGNPEDQYKLAMCYMEGEGFSKDIKAAKEWLLKAARNGHATSQKALGDLYFNGVGVEKNSNEAIKWYSLAAKGGNSSAQAFLGDCYLRGVGVKQNIELAIDYYKSASKLGDDKVEEKLGQIYSVGVGGIKKDIKEAVKWYWLSADKGNNEAAYYLAICYNEGLGIEKNNAEALKWIEKSVNGGVEKGQSLYCILAYDDAVNSMNSKEYLSAISRFNSVICYDKNNIDAYINRGYCYLNRAVKDYASAERDFRKALKLDENNTTAKSNLAVVVAYNERITEAKNLCDVAYQYYTETDYTNAVANCAKAISLDNTKPYPYFLVGCCYSDSKLYVEAIDYFNQALSVDPDYDKARKAIKRARTLGIINAIGQAASTLSNSLNSAYSSSKNYTGSSSYRSSTNSMPISSSVSPKRKVCSYCHGTKVCQDRSYAATFGQDRVIKDVSCPICGSYESHYHKSCIPCQGKGYIESY